MTAKEHFERLAKHIDLSGVRLAAQADIQAILDDGIAQGELRGRKKGMLEAAGWINEGRWATAYYEIGKRTAKLFPEKEEK